MREPTGPGRDPGCDPVDPERLIAALRGLSGCTELELLHGPEHLTFGAEADIDIFELDNHPPSLSGQLVLRRIFRPTDPDQVVREVALHKALKEQQFPVPRVMLFDATDEWLGVPFLVMERIPGEPPMSEVVAPGDLLLKPWRLPSLAAEALGRVPKLLGETHARLHQLDPAGVRCAQVDYGLNPASIGFPARLEALEDQVSRADLPGLGDGLAWLGQKAPPEERQVICHGDFVFTNVHIESNEVMGILDWSNAALAAPEFDVAATLILLKSQVPGVPRSLAAFVSRVQRRMARSYLRAYKQSLPIDPTAIRYYSGFWLLQQLATSGERIRAGDMAGGHLTERWLHPSTIHGAVREFKSETGIALHPLEPELPGT